MKQIHRDMFEQAKKVYPDATFEEETQSTDASINITDRLTIQICTYGGYAVVQKFGGGDELASFMFHDESSFEDCMATVKRLSESKSEEE